MVLAQLELQLHLFDLETEADDGAQFRAMFGTRGIELPGLADTGFEAVADRADQFGQRLGIVEGLQLATQLGSGVVPGGYPRGGLLVRIPAGRDIAAQWPRSSI